MFNIVSGCGFVILITYNNCATAFYYFHFCRTRVMMVPRSKDLYFFSVKNVTLTAIGEEQVSCSKTTAKHYR